MVTVQIEYFSIGSEKNTYHIFISVSSVYIKLYIRYMLSKIIIKIIIIVGFLHEIGHFPNIYIGNFIDKGIYII